MAAVCVMCNGSGSVTTTWDFGASALYTCSTCGGSGEIQPPPVKTSGSLLSNIILDAYKTEIEKNLYAKSPILDMLESKINEAAKRMQVNLSKTIFGEAS